MLLPDHEIRSRLQDGSIQIDPYEDWMLQPASVDVTLGWELRWRRQDSELRTVPINPFDPDPGDWVRWKFEGDEYLLPPGKLVLGTTEQYIKLDPQIQAQLNGKSSLGRNGLMIHSTAGFVDPGFEGNVTLEMQNLDRRPLILRQGMPIGQLSFLLLSSPAERPYGHPDLGSHYQRQRGATVPSALRGQHELH